MVTPARNQQLIVRLYGLRLQRQRQPAKDAPVPAAAAAAAPSSFQEFQPKAGFHPSAEVL
jgi:hypothetical protein